MPRQLDLFTMPAPEPRLAVRQNGVSAAAQSPALMEVRDRLPGTLRLGTSSWSFPGWADIVYDRVTSKTILARDGLAAYSRHPLLRCVGIDRSFYTPLAEEAFLAHAKSVGDEFRFLVKAHDWCTLSAFPRHARHGDMAGATNPRFLDPEYATQAVVAPALAGLGPQLGQLVFQFPPQDPLLLGHRQRGPRSFPRRLESFLRQLPLGPSYAVELRNVELLTPEYADVLHELGASHCYNVHPSMPTLARQFEIIDPARQVELVVRWMLARHLGYEEARERFAPFDRIVEPDWATRSVLVEQILASARRDQRSYVIANNKAEGSAPLSLIELAELITQSSA